MSKVEFTADRQRLEPLESKIGYSFKNNKLLIEALTHSSAAGEIKTANNERLEFLGDSVLSLVVSNHLFNKYRNLSEGELTKLRSGLVCTEALSEFARSFGLGDFLFMGKGEIASGGRNRASLLENAFEALVGAIYLDGGFKAAERFILTFVPEDLKSGQSSAISDFKTALQEIIQQNPDEKINYQLIFESGPDHDKTFEVSVLLNSNVIGTGKGKSKKQAEQNAAKEALKLMGINF